MVCAQMLTRPVTWGKMQNRALHVGVLTYHSTQSHQACGSYEVIWKGSMNLSTKRHDTAWDGLRGQARESGGDR